MSAPSSEEKPLTMAFVGCGTMGISILGGILSSLEEMKSAPLASSSDADTPARLPSRFIACVRRAESAKKIQKALGDNPAYEVARQDNISAVQRSEVILLGCKPYMVEDVLKEEGMREALKGKLLISILAGVSVQQMEDIIYGGSDAEPEGRCQIVRAMTNTAALIRSGMTVVANSNPPLPSQVTGLVRWIFERVGEVQMLPMSNIDAATALCGSGTAFFALMLEAAGDGAVAMGIPRAEAQKMAAQTMLGAAKLVLNGEHPAILKDKTSTPGGCTIGGLLVLEEGTVRGTVARAFREATCVASQLGQGVQGVNGTRFNTK